MSAWGEYKKKLGNTRPWQALSKNEDLKADEEIAKSRMDICEQCPRLLKTTKQCKECGCFMALKTKLKNAACPIGKW